MAIAAPEFEYLRKILRESAAIVLDDDKQYLAESRLVSLLGREGFPSVQSLLEQLRARPSHELHRKVVDAMTNNETWFFRDVEPFNALRTTILPEMMGRRLNERCLTIWSAASSSGQEAYSAAMLICEQFPSLLEWNLRIVGTDICDTILERARHGLYSQLEVNRGLPAPMLTKYFSQRGLEWQICERIRKMVTFRSINLANPIADMPRADIVFLRNVLIYFDVEVKRKILGRLARMMAPDEYLFLGCAETTLNLSDEFERIQCGKVFCYRLCKRELR